MNNYYIKHFFHFLFKMFLKKFTFILIFQFNITMVRFFAFAEANFSIILSNEIIFTIIFSYW